MEKINQQCNNLSKKYSSVFFRHKEMSELLDKQVNAQKEKIFRGSRKLPQVHEKVCDENERRRKKNDTRVKIIFMEGSPL